MHIVCITGMNSLLWWQNAELQGCDSMTNGAFVGKIPFFIKLDFMSSFPRNGKGKKTFIKGPGVGRLATFSWKDDVINQTHLNPNFKQKNK